MFSDCDRFYEFDLHREAKHGPDRVPAFVSSLQSEIDAMKYANICIGYIWLCTGYAWLICGLLVIAIVDIFHRNDMVCSL